MSQGGGRIGNSGHRGRHECCSWDKEGSLTLCQYRRREEGEMILNAQRMKHDILNFLNNQREQKVPQMALPSLRNSCELACSLVPHYQKTGGKSLLLIFFFWEPITVDEMEPAGRKNSGRRISKRATDVLFSLGGHGSTVPC